MESASPNNLRRLLFKYRSYTPIPFLIVMVFYAKPTVASLLVGATVAVIGELTRFWGVSYAGSETRTTGNVGGTQLVTVGPYAHVRNPLYLGNILMYTGIGVMSNALMPYLVIVAVAYFAFQYSAIVALEEEYLGRTFSNWREYASSVPRFIPSLKKYPARGSLMPDYLRALRSERSSLIALSSVSTLLVVMHFYRRPV